MVRLKWFDPIFYINKNAQTQKASGQEDKRLSVFMITYSQQIDRVFQQFALLPLHDCQEEESKLMLLQV